jgi:hypothetical protein
LVRGTKREKGLDANEKRLTQSALPATKATEQRSNRWRGSQLTDVVNLRWRHCALSEFSYYQLLSHNFSRFHPSARAKRTIFARRQRAREARLNTSVFIPALLDLLGCACVGAGI